jgi:hypothetical protein
MNLIQPRIGWMPDKIRRMGIYFFVVLADEHAAYNARSADSMADGERLVASGGFCAPSYASFVVTYRVKGRLRRWWHRRTGWSTEWTLEYDYVPLVRYTHPPLPDTH